MAQSSAFAKKPTGLPAGCLPLKVTGTNTAGSVTIHTAVAGTTEGTFDEVWAVAYNMHTADVVLSIEFGDAALPMTVTIPYGAGLIPIMSGQRFQNGAVIKAFASVANVICVLAIVNRMTD